MERIDRPQFTTNPDVEFSCLSTDMNIALIGWEPAELLNVKHDAPEKSVQKDVF